VDVKPLKNRPEHPRIRYISGSSINPAIIKVITTAVAGRKCMVSLDSNHECEHVFQEIMVYRNMVTPGQYMVVEDTNLGSDITRPDFGPGPKEAVDRFMLNHNNGDFKQVRWGKKTLLTLNTGGWLLKKGGTVE